MPVARTFECPDCNGQFSHLFMRADEAPPSYCPLCGAFVGDSPAPLPPRPAVITGVAGRSGDAVYRAMEKAGEARQEMAAASTGTDRSEMASLKVTDLPSTPGASLSSTARQMLAGSAKVQHYGPDLAATTGDGPYPHAGNQTREAIRALHRRESHRVIVAGQMNRNGE